MLGIRIGPQPQIGARIAKIPFIEIIYFVRYIYDVKLGIHTNSIGCNKPYRGLGQNYDTNELCFWIGLVGIPRTAIHIRSRIGIYKTGFPENINIINSGFLVGKINRIIRRLVYRYVPEVYRYKGYGTGAPP